MKQLPLALGLRGAASLESFVVGANEAAVAALKAWHARVVAAGSRGTEPPLYLWGPTGSGKTHLLVALASLVQAHGGRVVWLDPNTAAAWDAEPTPDLVLIDQCEALDEAAQLAAFGVFVRAAESGFGIAAAGRQPPVDLLVREDLRTRLGWGEVHALQALSEAETRAALRREADLRGIFLGDEVMAYLLSRFQRDLRSLMALLDDIDAYSLAHKRQVTVPLVRRMLDEMQAPEQARLV
jgi:DnaA-homolog protein